MRRLFAAILPDAAAAGYARLVGVARSLAERIRSLDEPPDLSRVAGAVSDLLDRSVGAEEYVIRAAADGADAVDDGRIDLNAIDSMRSPRSAPGANAQRHSDSPRRSPRGSS